jgi:hypothetical protein
MKQSEILKVLSLETGAGDIDSINQVLKSKNFETKFRITGPGVVHFGFTGLIKAVTQEGVKVYNVNKVNLIRFDEIDTFAKAKPKVARPDPKLKQVEDEDEEDFENDDDFDAFADEDDDVIENESFKPKLTVNKKKMPKLTEHKKGSGSLFIPKKK